MAKVVISVSIDEEVLASIDFLAKRDDRKRSAFINLVLRENTGRKKLDKGGEGGK